MLILEGHYGRVHTLAFSPDGCHLASVAGRDSRVWLWDVVQGKCLHQAQHHRRVTRVAFPPNEQSLFVCCDSRGDLLSFDWEHQSWRVLAHIDPPASVPSELTFSADGNWLAAVNHQIETIPSQPFAYSYGGISVWTWGRALPIAETGLRCPMATCVALSQDGEMVAGSGLSRKVNVWHRKTRERIHQFDHAKKVHFLAWSPDQRTLASATLSGFVKIWDLERGRKLTTLHSKARSLQAIAYSPDGQMLATASSDALAQFWDVKTGEQRHAFDWEIGAVHSVAFSEDGMRAAAGGDGQIIVWDLDFDDAF